MNETEVNWEFKTEKNSRCVRKCVSHFSELEGLLFDFGYSYQADTWCELPLWRCVCVHANVKDSSFRSSFIYKLTSLAWNFLDPSVPSACFFILFAKVFRCSNFWGSFVEVGWDKNSQWPFAAPLWSFCEKFQKYARFQVFLIFLKLS